MPSALQADPCRVWMVALLLVLTGCYQSHPGGDRTHVADSGDRAPDPDVGPPTLRDARVDGDAPLPRDPFVDPGPDARPSDDPEASDWGAPPDLDPDAPCCEPLGPPIDVRVGSDPAGDVALEWNGDGWGLLYTEIPRAAFQELAGDGSPVGSLRRYEVGGLGARLVWSRGRFGAIVTREGGGDQDTVFALLDRRGVVDAGWTDLTPHLSGLGAKVARVDHLDRWVAVESERGPMRAAEIDARARVLTARRVADAVEERSQVVGLKSRAVAFWNVGGNTFARVLTLPLTELDTEAVMVAPVALVVPAATRLRDRALLVGPVFGDEGRLVSLDPFTGEVEEHRLANPLSPFGFIDAVGLDVPGVVALCNIGVTDGTVGSLELHVLAADGTAIGAPVRVSEDAHVHCAVGAQGDNIFVAWPIHHLGVVRVQGYGLRGG